LLDVRHQVHAQNVLQRALSRDRLPHAYLFHGPDGVGKERLALGLAQRLLCSRPRTSDLTEAEAAVIGPADMTVGCGSCHDCHTIDIDNHPDVHVIHRHRNREHPDSDVRKRSGLEITVEVIRHFLIEKAALSSVQGRGKVFIIREADRISSSAQNAMLKTLEEPPPGTYIILLASSAERLLPTTRSRCQLVRLDALPTAFVEAKLAELAPDLSPELHRWYARLSDGSIGHAVERLRENLHEVNQTIAASCATVFDTRRPPDSKAWIDLAGDLSNHYRERDPEISDTEATRQALKALLKLAATWFADLLRTAAGHEETVVNQSAVATHRDRLGRLGLSPGSLDTHRTEIEAIAACVQAFSTAERRLDQNVNTQLAIDSLLIGVARLAGSASGPRGHRPAGTPAATA
jgi:DNA polymerase-3 subunit delta'